MTQWSMLDEYSVRIWIGVCPRCHGPVREEDRKVGISTGGLVIRTFGECW